MKVGDIVSYSTMPSREREEIGDNREEKERRGGEERWERRDERGEVRGRR